MQHTDVPGRKGIPLLGQAARSTTSTYGFFLSLGVIFVAELGDKSQLMALAFAARCRARDVLIGITVATAVVHLASVGIGRLVGEQFSGSQWVISIVAGVTFPVFAAWTPRGDRLTASEADRDRQGKGAALLAVGVDDGRRRALRALLVDRDPGAVQHLPRLETFVLVIPPKSAPSLKAVGIPIRDRSSLSALP